MACRLGGRASNQRRIRLHGKVTMESFIGFTQGLVLIGQAVLVGSCLIGQILQFDDLRRRLDLMARVAGLTTLPLLVLLYALRARVMLDLPLSAVCTSDGLVMLETRVGQTLE